ncbi:MULTISPECIES: DUF2281 domain-containing protein [unclassified Empedobacter]|uniref:DUF2281 domain-containing protein n=1 Tax=unclassified Empedobacter TaxID=2643773 RepID=UPI0025C0CA4A|nr:MULTISPECIES: DUF2281 domain-containing protein [unclassified Empedobacter]
MNATTIEQVNSKLKQLPESLLEEVERYIDFLTYKHNQETEFELSDEQKEILDNRLNELKENFFNAKDVLKELHEKYDL